MLSSWRTYKTTIDDPNIAPTITLTLIQPYLKRPILTSTLPYLNPYPIECYPSPTLSWPLSNPKPIPNPSSNLTFNTNPHVNRTSGGTWLTQSDFEKLKEATVAMNTFQEGRW